MVHVRKSVTTAAPLAQVFRYLADFENVPGWDPGIAEARRLGRGPIAVGTRFEIMATLLGRRVPTTYEISELSEDEHSACIRVHGRGNGFESRDTIELAISDGHTRVTYDAEMSLTGGLRHIEWLFAPLIRRMGDKAVAGLGDALARGASMAGARAPVAV